MKKIKVLCLLSLIISAGFFIACSNDENSTTETQTLDKGIEVNESSKIKIKINSEDSSKNGYSCKDVTVQIGGWGVHISTVVRVCCMSAPVGGFNITCIFDKVGNTNNLYAYVNLGDVILPNFINLNITRSISIKTSTIVEIDGSLYTIAKGVYNVEKDGNDKYLKVILEKVE